MVNGKMPYEAVSLACDTRNCWWQGGMDNATCGCALRLVHMSLRLGHGDEGPSLETESRVSREFYW